MSETPKQKAKVEQVMHEFKEGDLKSSAGAKVENPKQAIAIGLRVAGVPPRKGDSQAKKSSKKK